MKRRIIYSVLTITFATLCLFRALASSAALDSASVYERAKSYVSFGLYEDALDQFEQITYKDSSSWQDYCKAMISISRANSFEHDGYISNAIDEIKNAKKQLNPLANISFENSEELYEYCTVRSDELSGLIQQAIDGYSRVYDVLDSAERYHRLINGALLPTQAPDPNPESPVLTPYLFRANRNLIPYAGPGASYGEIEGISITVDTDVWVCAIERGKSGTYYMSETDTERGKIRFWAVDFRLDPVDMDMKYNLPEIGPNPRNAVVLEDAEALFGPGDSYCNAGLIIPKGTKATAFDEEGAYTMIEYVQSRDDSLMRVWIRTNSLV